MNIEGICYIIKERRLFLNIEQKVLAELAGVSVHTISNIELGKANPTVEVLNKIVSVLGMDLMVKVNNES